MTAAAKLCPNPSPRSEIAKLVTGNPALKIFVVGHTDMVGDAVTVPGAPGRRPPD